MDYMMAGVPVLHSVEAGNDPVAEAGCGLTVAPESAAAVAEGLRRLAALRRASAARWASAAAPSCCAHHTYPVLARRFLEAVSMTQPQPTKPTPCAQRYARRAAADRPLQPAAPRRVADGAGAPARDARACSSSSA